MKTFKYSIAILIFFSVLTSFSQSKKLTKHVIVVGFDGLSPDGLEKAITPTFDKIISEGSYSFHARAVLPTSSSSNWASMIMGAGPEQHGIISNSWEKNNFVLPAVVQSEDFIFPTIFSLIDKQVENAEIGAIYHWDGFGRLFEKSAVDYDVIGKTEDETAHLASQYIENKKPTFTFIHFDHIDGAGHEFGHGSKEYYKSVEKADKLLEQVFNAIKKAGIADETVVIISSDHGGVGLGHGGESLAEIEIPFILWGKSVKKNHKINYPVYQYDNAATVAFALGLKTPIAWIGKPVKNAFIGFSETDEYPLPERLKEPMILPKANLNKKAGGLFDEQTEIIIENPNDTGKVFYTIDGTMPSKDSKAYKAPFKTTENTVVKSAIILDGKISSAVSEAYFRVKSKNLEAPVTYELFYLENLSGIPYLKNRTPDSLGGCFEITSDEVKQEIKSNTVVRFKTQIVIEKDGEYTFYTRSDDGSKLWVNNLEVVDNDGDHGVKEKSGKIALKPGKYPLEVIWFNGGGGSWLDVFYQSAEIPKQILPTTILKFK
jgi:hypothetical protein